VVTVTPDPRMARNQKLTMDELTRVMDEGGPLDASVLRGSGGGSGSGGDSGSGGGSGSGGDSGSGSGSGSGGGSRTRTRSTTDIDCKKVKQDCREKCSDMFPTGDFAASFWKCLRECLEASGCW
jgi:hypothetical protein